MKIAMHIVGILLILMGGVWFLQGIYVLPGSFMTGQIQWAFCGGLTLIIGIALNVWARRLRRGPAGGQSEAQPGPGNPDQKA
jgi:hypothetical protein